MNVREMARAMGRRGGRARARRLSPQRRREIAALGGQARHRSLLLARRIADNFHYVEAALELRGGRRKVLRMKTFRGRLPGHYPDRS
jgi:general stress protein YciG